MSYRDYEQTPARTPNLTSLQTEIDANEEDVAALDNDLDAVANRVTILEKTYFQNVDTLINTDGGLVDTPWFPTQTKTLSLDIVGNESSTRYRLTGVLDMSVNAGNTGITALRLRMTTSGTVSLLRCLVTSSVDISVEHHRIIAVNSDTLVINAPLNLENKNVRCLVEGFIVITSAVTLEPQFSWSVDPGGADGTIHINTGTFFEAKYVSSDLNNWS